MEVKINKLDNLGQGIAYINDKVCFIKNALPGEIVDIEIKSDKKKYQKAEIKKINKKNEYRKENICPYHNLCGGCTLGHLSYEKALEYKTNKLKEIILKNTNLNINPIMIKNNKEYHYRNKITLKIKDYEWGYYNSESHNFVAINKCLLAKNSINKIVENQHVFHIKTGEIIIRSNNLNEILISIKTDETYEIELDKINNLNIIGIIVNDKVIKGKNHFYHSINNIKYKISYNSFFQVNDYICSQIFNILNNMNLGHTILDLYCGVGSLGLSVSNKVKKIYGIEIIENAIIDAKHNANLNNIKNAKYYVGKVENNINKINDEIDAIIVDPPRKGLNNLDEIINIDAKNVIYISCDPITLGRDLNVLKDYYDIKEAYALDMFPNTYHVESMVLLMKKW